jgi:hypothetical protein
MSLRGFEAKATEDPEEGRSQRKEDGRVGGKHDDDWT